MDKQQPTLGFDIGGTNLRGGVISPSGQLLEMRSCPTPTTATGLVTAIAQLSAELQQQWPLAAVGVAIAGFVDEHCAQVRFAPHLKLRDYPLQQQLAARLNIPVLIEHDANSAAWGEYRFGAAQSVGIWALLTLGTGIGGALLIDGELYRGRYGTAPEFGHLPVVPGGRPCPCGKAGCLERYASGTALEAADAALAEAAGASPARTPRTGPQIVAAARAGEAQAQAAVQEVATWLGTGLSMVADILDPELILIGGGLSAELDLFLPHAQRVMEQAVVGAGYRPLPILKKAALGPDAGMIGVADRARQVYCT